MTLTSPIRRLPLLLGMAALMVLASPPVPAAPAPGSDEATALAAAGLTVRDGAYQREGCETAFKPATERIDINAHGVNKSTTVAGPITGLHGTT